MNITVEVKQIYNEQISLAKGLITLLQDEESVLKQRDISSLNEMTAQKKSLLEKFDLLEVKRRQLLEQAGDNLSTENAQHQKLKKLLQDIQHQNRINASILTVTQDFNQKTLDIIRGTSSQEKTYNALGNKENNSQSQSLAKV